MIVNLLDIEMVQCWDVRQGSGHLSFSDNHMFFPGHSLKNRHYSGKVWTDGQLRELPKQNYLHVGIAYLPTNEIEALNSYKLHQLHAVFSF